MDIISTLVENSWGCNLHCKRCKICRVGKGLEHENFHCDRCDAGVSRKYIKDHRCLKKSLDANCPICGHYIFTSTRPFVFMRCGHTMHAHCFDEYKTEFYTCPLCHKSLTEMRAYYAQIDKAVAHETLPPDMRNKQAEILCHECDERRISQYHYLYLKCMECDGYNTSLIRIFEKPSTTTPTPKQNENRAQSTSASSSSSSSAVAMLSGGFSSARPQQRANGTMEHSEAMPALSSRAAAHAILHSPNNNNPRNVLHTIYR